MLGQFRLTGSVHQTVKDGVDVDLEQDIIAVPGWSAKLVANYPHDAAIPDGTGITYIDDRTITVLPSGDITEDGVTPGISLTANDDTLFDTPLQWTVKPGWVMLANKRRFKPRSWTFNAPAVDEEVSIGELTPVASEGMTSVARGPKGDPGPEGPPGPGGVAAWSTLTGKPAVIAAGADQAAARTAIGAGTSNLALGTTGSTAKAGNYQPAWTDVTAKPAVIAAGADQAAARTAIGATTIGANVLTSPDALTARKAIRAADEAASGAMRNLMTKLTEGVSDATWLIVGDSTGNATNEWVYLTVQWLATRFPAYTVNYYLWDEGGNAWPGSPTVVQTGTGPFALTVWNASVPGSKTGYFQGSRFNNLVKNADLIAVNYGHNQGGPVNTDSLRQFHRNKYLSLVDEVAAVNPNAGVVCILQNPSVDGAFGHDEEWQSQRAIEYAQAASYRGWGVVNVLRAFYDYGDWAADLTDNDGIHPSPAGSTLWAAQVQAALERASKVSVTTQPPSPAPSRQIIANPEFTEWTGTNPDGVTMSTSPGVTASKELSDYETGVQALKITSDAVDGQPYAEWAGTADALGIKGMLANRTWTVAVRLKIPAANTSVVRVLVRDNNGSSQSVYTDVDDAARDRYIWTYVTKTFASNATSVSIRVSPKTYGTAIATCTVDRIYMVPGAVPITGGMAPKIQIGPSSVTFSGGEVQTAAEANIPRLHVTGASYVTMASGTAVFGYFRAKQNITLANLRAYSGSTAAAATPTLVKLGVYSVDQTTGDLTLLGATTSDTTLFASTFTGYTKALTAPVALVAGQEYAYSVLEVSGVAVASLWGVVAAGFQTEYFRAPRLSAIVAGQTDLQASYTFASLTAKNGVPYIVGLSA